MKTKNKSKNHTEMVTQDINISSDLIDKMNKFLTDLDLDFSTVLGLLIVEMAHCIKFFVGNRKDIDLDHFMKQIQEQLENLMED